MAADFIAPLRVVVATQNPGKLRELKALLSGLELELLSVEQVLDGPWVVEETETTFEGNAALKARTLCERTKLVALADDSGLEVDALGGAPGIYSARYAGAGATDSENVNKLLSSLREHPRAGRRARFRCVLALAIPSVEPCSFAEGRCEGYIVEVPRGEAGFGYDPVFVAEASPDRTFAELTANEKNALSHRKRAVEALRPILAALQQSRPPR